MSEIILLSTTMAYEGLAVALLLGAGLVVVYTVIMLGRISNHVLLLTVGGFFFVTLVTISMFLFLYETPEKHYASCQQVDGKIYCVLKENKRIK